MIYDFPHIYNVQHTQFLFYTHFPISHKNTFITPKNLRLKNKCAEKPHNQESVCCVACVGVCMFEVLPQNTSNKSIEFYLCRASFEKKFAYCIVAIADEFLGCLFFIEFTEFNKYIYGYLTLSNTSFVIWRWNVSILYLFTFWVVYKHRGTKLKLFYSRIDNVF